MTTNHEGEDRLESYNSEAKEIRSSKSYGGTAVAIIIFSLPFTVLKLSVITSF